MSGSTVASIGALVHHFPALRPILDEHLADNDGEILPHLVMADIVCWLAANAESQPETCRAVLNWLEREFLDGPEDVRGMITVSGVEMIPDPGRPGAILRDWLGPNLRAIDSWR